MLLLDVGIYDEFYSYTDYHDVDEDARTIVRHGRYWGGESYAGITQRGVNDNPTNTFDAVASSNIQNMKLYGHA